MKKSSSKKSSSSSLGESGMTRPGTSKWGQISKGAGVDQSTIVKNISSGKKSYC